MWTAADSKLASFRGLEIVHLLHIYKTGGTAIKHALETAKPDRYALRMWGHSFKLADAPVGDKVVFVVRDPVSRFVSAFNFSRLKGLPAHPREWTSNEEQVFSEFATANELAESLHSTHGADAMSKLPHFAPLVDWLGRSADLEARMSDILFVGHVETLDDDFARLCEILGVRVDLPANGVKRNRTPADPAHPLSKRAVANLRDWYADDYQLLETIGTLERRKHNYSGTR